MLLAFLRSRSKHRRADARHQAAQVGLSEAGGLELTDSGEKLQCRAGFGIAQRKGACASGAAQETVHQGECSEAREAGLLFSKKYLT